VKNQLYTGTPTSRRFVTLPVTSPTLKAGAPILVGIEPAFLLDDYQSNVGGATALFNGTFLNAVSGVTQISPAVGHAINPGDQLYADGGTLDSATNVRYGFTIDANTGGIAFGQLDPSSAAVGSTLTATVGVRI
jgi:hypothetical protein